ncbi:MAG TPA: helix-turn-helix transcriptional regulator [Candidatus Ruania gallistercoris]|uniref:Helix-turn-helix transcriptional regulator n=1 Tax=Candidatus Ruania gallistercoris TaxID=2838746 RepID=A0A9D2J3J1_9MICO|nr:helix-turn-helix transcriptional regulator [Candidatus Ruania gallistercoris]
MADEHTDPVTLGKRIRHFRGRAGLTLAQLAASVSTTAGQLSHIENGRREPRLSLLQAIAGELSTSAAELLEPAPPPDRRAALEIELHRAQASPLFAALGAPAVRPTRTLPLPVLESLVALHRELARRAAEAIATPEEARRANTQMRLDMRARGNYLPEIEELGEEVIRKAGYTSGALTHSTVSTLARSLGFEIIHVPDLPHSTRTVTDLENGRIYLPPASIPGGHGLRSLALQAIGHRLLGHTQPAGYADFLYQRVEIAYFAATCLIPRSAALDYLLPRQRAKDLAIEDFRDAFGVTHDFAALRLTNLATSHLDMPVHYLRVGEDGALYKGYENDGVALPSDVTGAIEGQPVCRQWAARAAFARRTRTTEFHQYTDTPEGTFWCSTQTGSTSSGEFTITVGVPFAHAKWFRGRETKRRATSTCPDEGCCRRPEEALSQRWQQASWPSAVSHAQILGPLPSGRFPGVDDTEVYQFLEANAPTEPN